MFTITFDPARGKCYHNYLGYKVGQEIDCNFLGIKGPEDINPMKVLSFGYVFQNPGNSFPPLSVPSDPIEPTGIAKRFGTRKPLEMKFPLQVEEDEVFIAEESPSPKRISKKRIREENSDEAEEAEEIPLEEEFQDALKLKEESSEGSDHSGSSSENDLSSEIEPSESSDHIGSSSEDERSFENSHEPAEAPDVYLADNEAGVNIRVNEKGDTYLEVERNGRNAWRFSKIYYRGIFYSHVCVKGIFYNWRDCSDRLSSYCRNRRVLQNQVYEQKKHPVI